MLARPNAASYRNIRKLVNLQGNISCRIEGALEENGTISYRKVTETIRITITLRGQKAISYEW